MSAPVKDRTRARGEDPTSRSDARSSRLRRALHFDSMAVMRVVVVLFFFVFLVIPLVSLLIVSVTGQPANIIASLFDADVRQTNLERLGDASIATFVDTVTTTRYVNALRNSIVLATGVALISLVVCVPIAYGFARTAMPFKKTLAALCTVPIVVPTFVAAAGFVIMFGRTGWVTYLYQSIGMEGQLFNPSSLLGITLALLFFLFPFALWPMVAAFRVASTEVEGASKNLGARNGMTFMSVTVPLALPGIISAALLIFAIAFSDFGAAIILAPSDLNLIVVSAYREIAGFFNWEGAATLVIVMVAVTGAFFALQRVVLRGRDYGTLTARGGGMELNRNPRTCRILAAYTALVALVPTLALLSVLMQSFATTWGADLLPRGYTLDHYRTVLARSGDSISNSLVLAGATLVLSLFIAVFVTYFVIRRNSGTMDFLSTIPLVIPGIALGIALIQSFNMAPLALTGTATLLVIGYAIRRLPYMLRSTMSSMQAIGGEVEEAAANLGASRLVAMGSVVLPLLAPALLTGSILLFVTVIKETSITVLVAPNTFQPMSYAIFVSLMRGELYSASALSVLLVALVMVLQQLAMKFAPGSSVAEK
jgi:iron(III) transport system permease protein